MNGPLMNRFAKARIKRLLASPIARKCADDAIVWDRTRPRITGTLSLRYA